MLHKKNLSSVTSLALGLVVFSGGPAFAQAIPGGGNLLNQQQQERTKLPRQAPQVEEEAPRAEIKPDKAGVRVQVRDFRFTGNRGVATDVELKAVVEKSIGREMTFAELQAAAEDVNSYLKEKGFPLARAYLPKQDVTEGHIEIAIRQGTVEQQGAHIVTRDTRISTDILKDVMDSALPDDRSTPRKEDVERGVLLIDDMPGLSAHATMERGAKPGTTRLQVEVTEGPWVTGRVSADNYGNRYTGTWQASPSLSLNDPLGIGDQLTLSTNHSSTGGLGLYQVGYSLPLGADGLRFAAAYSYLDYELDEGLAGVSADGTAQTASGTFTYPFLRTRETSVWGSAGYTYKKFEDYIAGSETSDRDVNEGTLNVVATHNDAFGGGGVSNAVLAVTYGELDRSGNASDLLTDSTTARTDGTFSKATFSAARLQYLTESFSLFGAVRGQATGDNLDSSEKFILGGPAGIRAYPIGEGTGDQGWVGNVELRYDVPAMPEIGKLQLVGFADMGGVQINRDNWTGGVTTMSGDNAYTLGGAGVGANLSVNEAVDLRASWAIAIGDNPGRTAQDLNADARRRNNQFWVQAAVSF